MTQAHCMPDNLGYTHSLSLRICTTYCLSTAAMGARACIHVMSYIHCLSCITHQCIISHYYICQFKMQGQKYQKTSYANHQGPVSIFYYRMYNVIMGYVVAHLVEVLHYKTTVSLAFFIDILLPAAIWLWG